jgi:hypothetical protein
MDDIAEKDDRVGLQLSYGVDQLPTDGIFVDRPELAATPQRPTVAHMHIGQKRGPAFAYP